MFHWFEPKIAAVTMAIIMTMRVAMMTMMTMMTFARRPEPHGCILLMTTTMLVDRRPEPHGCW